MSAEVVGMTATKEVVEHADETAKAGAVLVVMTIGEERAAVEIVVDVDEDALVAVARGLLLS